MKKITDLPALSAADPADLLPIVDISGNVTDKIAVSALTSGFNAKTIPTSKIDGGTTAGTLVTSASGVVSVAPSGATNAVAAMETTTSTTYANLATVGPAVTVTIGSSGSALVVLTAAIYNFNSSNYSWMSYAVSGASTVAASDARSMYNIAISPNRPIGRQSVVIFHTGLTPGSTTFTAKYRCDGGTTTGENREICVIPL